MPTILMDLTPAQRGVIEQFNKEVEVATILTLILILLAIVPIAYGVTLLRDRFFKPQRQANPSRLFHNLLDDLSLDENDQKLMTKASEAFDHPNPSVMLISPRYFQRAMRSMISAEAAEDDTSTKEQIEHIYQTLFPNTE